MERIAKERNKNLGPVSTCSGAPEISGTSNTTSYLLEQIGILKTRNQDILDEHKKTLRKYEDKLAEQDRQLASLTEINAALRAEVDGSLARTPAVCIYASNRLSSLRMIKALNHMQGSQEYSRGNA